VWDAWKNQKGKTQKSQNEEATIGGLVIFEQFNGSTPPGLDY